MHHLDGKIAIITGAGGGIGRAIAMRLSLEGATVVAADLDGKAAQGLIQEIVSEGRRGLALQTNVSDEKDVERMFEESRGNFGPVDILVNNAGLGTVGLMIDHSLEDWEKSMSVNLKGTFLCSRAAAKEMIARKRGRSLPTIGGGLQATDGKPADGYFVHRWGNTNEYFLPTFLLRGLSPVSRKQ